MAFVSYTDEGTPFIRNDWHVEDVISCCKDLGVTLTDADIEDVMYQVANSFDANYGITWEHFHFAIEDVLRAKLSAVSNRQNKENTDD